MKILLAIDPSPASETVLNALLARPYPAGTTATVITVIAPKYLRGDPAVAKELEMRENKLVQRAAEQLRLHELTTTSLVVRGDPKEVIVDYAANLGADFVLVGAHGETALPRFLLGSVARAVARFAPCSVGVVRTTSRQALPDGGLSILLATDGSKPSLLAAHSVADRPWPTNTEVRILSVAEAPHPPVEAPAYESAATAVLTEETVRWSENAARDAEAILAGHGLNLSIQSPPRFGSPKQVILDTAQQWGADLIVVGSHGTTGVTRFLIGSVSEAIAMHADCSVEVIRKQLGKSE